jgi:hypothetical protein
MRKILLYVCVYAIRLYCAWFIFYSVLKSSLFSSHLTSQIGIPIYKTYSRPKDRNYGRRNCGWCIKAMRQLSAPWNEAVFSRWMNSSAWTPLPPIHQMLPLWLLLFLQSEECVGTNSFSVCRWCEIENGGPAEQGVNWWPATPLWTTENSYVAAYRYWKENTLKGMKISS